LATRNLAELEFCTVAYSWNLVGAKVKSVRHRLENVEKSMTECIGFNRYWGGGDLRGSKFAKFKTGETIVTNGTKQCIMYFSKSVFIFEDPILITPRHEQDADSTPYF
jgi:hypothetical protein